VLAGGEDVGAVLAGGVDIVAGVPLQPTRERQSRDRVAMIDTIFKTFIIVSSSLIIEY
jgi:hypothetical protein